jgi:hypothetical protein
VPLATICEGSSGCVEKLLTSGIAFLLLGSIAIAFTARFMRINAKRRAQGRDSLSWRDIADSRMTTAEASSADTTALEAAKELKRQIEWERHIAGSEMLRYGRSRSRTYCSTHDRHCKEPTNVPHPPGGIDNETAPPDWKAN